MESEGITKVVTIHPEKDMDFRIKFHDSLSNSFWHISLKTTNVNLIVALEKSGGHWSQENSSSGNYECLDKIS